VYSTTSKAIFSRSHEPIVGLRMKRILSEAPARPLVSREICMILGGIIGCLATFCDTSEIKAALEFIHAHQNKYMSTAALLRDFGDLGSTEAPS
jgi:hypothetical protein